MNAKENPKHPRRNRPHKLKVHLPNQGPRIDGRRQSTKDTDFQSQIRSLLLGQRHERLRRALRVANEAQPLEARLGQHARHESRQVHDAHLPDIPGPHARIGVGEHLVFRLEAAPVVAEPDVVTAANMLVITQIKPPKIKLACR